MRRFSAAVATTMLGSTLALGVPGAATAGTVEFGSNCMADTAPDFNTYVLTSALVGGLPVAAPSSGVITKAAFSIPVVPQLFPTFVKVVHPTGVPNQFKVMAQSQLIAVEGGVHTYDVRVPVASGDLLALWGTSGTLLCLNSVEQRVASVVGNSAPGSTATYAPQAYSGLPVKATVEPDIDLDGYGDVTQDFCPQSASFQTACPVIKIDSRASASGRSIKVTATTSSTANVSVTGIAKAGRKKIKLTGGSKTVQPGALTDFKVKLPKALKAALAKLPPSKKITVTLTASATDLVGRVTTDVTKVKLPGTHP
jgi:hypothetical protein